MPSIRETVLDALHTRLRTLTAPVLRGDVLPERIPATGLIILRDGKPGEPEVTLSGTVRDALFDALTVDIGAVLAADRTLGGVCDWVEAEAPEPVDLPIEGAASLKAAVITIVLHYASSDPLI